MRRMTDWLKKRIEKKVPADTVIMYVAVILIGLTVFLIAIAEYNNFIIVRQLEAASDLAAVEAVRYYIDETELRNERLEIKESDIPLIRDKYLEKVRACIPNVSTAILRIEIPTIVDNVIEIPDDLETAEFPNSDSEDFVDYGDQYGGKQHWYLLDGNTPGTAAAALVQDFSNLDTASDHPRTSYIFTVKMTVIYKALPIFGRTGSLLNFVDIFTDEPVTLHTKWSDKGISCVTIESQGKVTLR